MFHILLLVTIFIVICLVMTNKLSNRKKQYLEESKHSDFDKQIEYNKKNSKTLDKVLSKRLIDVVDMLGSKKLDYNDWIDYVQKNVEVNHENNKYYFQVYQTIDYSKVLKHDEYIVKVSQNKNTLENTFSNLLEINKTLTVSTKFQTDPNVINNMYILNSVRQKVPRSDLVKIKLFE